MCDANSFSYGVGAEVGRLFTFRGGRLTFGRLFVFSLPGGVVVRFAFALPAVARLLFTVLLELGFAFALALALVFVGFRFGLFSLPFLFDEAFAFSDFRSPPVFTFVVALIGAGLSPFADARLMSTATV